MAGHRKPGPRRVSLSAAKRRQLASNKVTIDVMVLYTPKVAKKYLDIDTDLVALAIEYRLRLHCPPHILDQLCLDPLRVDQVASVERAVELGLQLGDAGLNLNFS